MSSLVVPRKELKVLFTNAFRTMPVKPINFNLVLALSDYPGSIFDFEKNEDVRMQEYFRQCVVDGFYPWKYEFEWNGRNKPGNFKPVRRQCEVRDAIKLLGMPAVKSYSRVMRYGEVGFRGVGEDSWKAFVEDVLPEFISRYYDLSNGNLVLLEAMHIRERGNYSRCSIETTPKDVSMVMRGRKNLDSGKVSEIERWCGNIGITPEQGMLKFL